MYGDLPDALGKPQYHGLNCHLLLKECHPSIGSIFLSLSLICNLSPFSFHVLTCPSLCRLQGVSVPFSVALHPCSDLALPLWSTVGECPLLGHFLSVS